MYFVGRRDDMLKTSGYRVSPTEVEDALYETGLVAEAAVFGKPHVELGQSLLAIVMPADPGSFSSEQLIERCSKIMPSYMVPHDIIQLDDGLPRNPNGKIDRTVLRAQFSTD